MVCLVTHGRDLWMFCGLQKWFMGCLKEIMVYGSLKKIFSGSEAGVGNFGGCEAGLGGFEGTWIGFAGIHDT